MILRGKTALVTGGSRGIGRAICRRLSEMGADVLIGFSGNEEAAKETREMCENAAIFGADVADSAACEAMFRFCEETFGPPDILINNAGITRDNLLVRMSAEDFERVLAVNLTGAFNCTKLACRTMIRKKSGRIINIASVVGLSGNAGQANYSASKAGLIGLTKSAARELASRSITVNAVAPGFIDTDMTAGLSDGIRESMGDLVPLSRFGTPDDVAGAVLFLASPDAAYITGQVIVVDGGMHI